MATVEKERELLRKFESGTLAPNAILDLKAKGSYKVSEIEDMAYTEEGESPYSKQDSEIDAIKEALKHNRNLSNKEKQKEYMRQMKKNWK